MDKNLVPGSVMNRQIVKVIYRQSFTLYGSSKSSSYEVVLTFSLLLVLFVLSITGL